MHIGSVIYRCLRLLEIVAATIY